ncbi:hypothetical protein BX600DRAFT_154649 [Xylariales sp. PMI_506]|nr:hypothetical protein BX600DRAFT_154649 [Xylariales sp. PMI_506]
MPLINGRKMACEPCIRGHRSTSCNHASERVMVPVRKPGRPLNECPHPAEAKCECLDVTVAFPRKRKCACPSTKPSATATSTKSSPATSPSVDDGRQAKSRSRRTGSRVLSDTPRNPSAYIAPSITAASSTTKVPGTGSTQDQLDALWNWSFEPSPAINGGTAHSNEFAYAPQLAPSKTMRHGASEQNITPITTMSSPIMGSEPEEDSEPSKPDCCSRRASSLIGFTAAPENPSSRAAIPSRPVRPGANSGSSQQPGHETTRNIRGNSSVQRSQSYTREPTYFTPTPSTPQSIVAESSFPQPVTVHPPSCSNCGHQQPAIIVLPQNHVAQVWNPAQWAPPPVPPGGGAIAYVIYPAANGVIPVPPRPTPPAITSASVGASASASVSNKAATGGCCGGGSGSNNNGNSSGSGNSSVPELASLSTIHECSCGPGCQCIGCIAHPFNEATQEYVRSAYEDFFDTPGDQDSNPTSPPTTMIPYDQTAAAVMDDGGAPLSMSQTLQIMDLGAGASEQILSADDFFFVEYPMTRGGFSGGL